MIEQHINIGDLAKRLAMSPEKVRLMVKDEPGVVCSGDRKKMYRIPESVAERILRRMTNPPKN